MKPTTKQIFLLKTVLGIIFAMHAGNEMAYLASSAYIEVNHWGNFMPEFIFTFFSLMGIVLIQWFLFSDYLPKWWVTLGLAGSIIAAVVSGLTFLLFLTFDINHSFIYETIAINAAISGMLLALPQLFILKNKKGYLWILANSVGLVIYFVGLQLPHIIQTPSAYLLSFESIIRISSLPFSLMIGFYLYTYVCNPIYRQAVESRNE